MAIENGACCIRFFFRLRMLRQLALVDDDVLI